VTDAKIPLRMGFLTGTDPRDRRSFSGTHFRMLAALERHVQEVVVLGPHPRLARWETIFRRLNRVIAPGGKGKFYFQGSLLWAYVCGRYFRSAIRAAGPLDVVFAPAASVEIALLPASLPLYYASDATHKLLRGYYENFSGYLTISDRHAQAVEMRAVRKASLLTYSSEWAARSAISDYGADPAKVHVIPYGANLDQIPSPEVAARRIARAGKGTLELMFLGVEWNRKGGPIAHQALLSLLEAGVDARLRVVGCVPPPGFEHPRMEVVPRLDKNIPEQRERLESLLAEASFLLVPTRADCTPVAFCEAAANGIPVLTTRTGGVPSVVIHGTTGYCLEPSETGSSYAAVAKALWEDPEGYARMAQASLRRYDEFLNWDRWAESVANRAGGLARRNAT